MSAPKKEAKKPPAPAHKPPEVHKPDPPHPATKAEAKPKPAAKPAGVANVFSPGPERKGTKPAPRPIINAPAPRPVPGGRLPSSPSTTPLAQLPAMSAEQVAAAVNLTIDQTGATEGIPSSEVGDMAVADILGGEFQTDVSARTYQRSLQIGGTIKRSFDRLYNGGAPLVHSSRARQYVDRHSKGAFG